MEAWEKSRRTCLYSYDSRTKEAYRQGNSLRGQTALIPNHIDGRSVSGKSALTLTRLEFLPTLHRRRFKKIHPPSSTHLQMILDTGGHRVRVTAVTLDNMAEDAVTPLVSLWQILTMSVRFCGPAFVSWLSMLWDSLTRNPELQWFGISLQFRLKVSRGDEGVGHVCFPGTRVSVGPDEGTAVYRWT